MFDAFLIRFSCLSSFSNELRSAMSVRCVVFDLDDTLWSTSETLLRAHQAMCEALLLEGHPAEAPEAFRERMQQVQRQHPEQQHDFGFCRKQALMKLTGAFK